MKDKIIKQLFGNKKGSEITITKEKLEIAINKFVLDCEDKIEHMDKMTSYNIRAKDKLIDQLLKENIELTEKLEKSLKKDSEIQLHENQTEMNLSDEDLEIIEDNI